jgi:uncharacterized protein YktB (UPF0637 family)
MELIIVALISLTIGLLVGRMYSQRRYEILLQRAAALEAENRAINSKMADQFKLISADLLEHQKKSVAETQQEKLGLMLDPLQKQIKDMLEKTTENKTRIL